MGVVYVEVLAGRYIRAPASSHDIMPVFGISGTQERRTQSGINAGGPRLYVGRRNPAMWMCIVLSWVCTLLYSPSFLASAVLLDRCSAAAMLSGAVTAAAEMNHTRSVGIPGARCAESMSKCDQSWGEEYKGIVEPSKQSPFHLHLPIRPSVPYSIRREEWKIEYKTCRPNSKVQ
ncbi:hypothetical protein BOTBODRAFT_144448 [Botryobasidium botryosum FD-172 SS1]|uniref:Uncharacterized protein n=1 Tax=Botryobasidium botryosum (strain FD-172 SS1) TaxID=930990 RepID=A0A067MLP0_BOTB1|nr:hypothetical protein BOTBODRAFT_144448 [Botryobasidium botryosum FD-172 SS1]